MDDLRILILQFIKDSQCQLGKTIAMSKLKSIENEITELTVKKNAEKIRKLVGENKLLDGKFSQVNFWKIKRKMIPNCREVAIGKRDSFGNLVTAETPLKKLYVDTYKERLSPVKIDSNYEDISKL